MGPVPRLAVFSLALCLLALAAAVVSFVEGSLLGILWLVVGGVTSNMYWYYRKSPQNRNRV
jgi:uncharacterized membrane protein YccC